MLRHQIAACSLVLLWILILPAPSSAFPWSVSLKAAAGRLIGPSYTNEHVRYGLEAELGHSITRATALGIEAIWWEEAGVVGFSHGWDPQPLSLDQRMRVFAVGGLIQLDAQVGATRPHVVVGAGDYVTIPRIRYDDGSARSRTFHAPGLSIGFGIAGTTPASLVAQVRWHQIFTDVQPYHTFRKTTDIVVASMGVSFR